MENFLLWYFVLREFTNKEICVTTISFFRSLCDENLNKKGKSPYKEILKNQKFNFSIFDFSNFEISIFWFSKFEKLKIEKSKIEKLNF